MATGSCDTGGLPPHHRSFGRLDLVAVRPCGTLARDAGCRDV